MKTFFSKFWDKFFGNDLSLRHIFFNIMSITAAVGGLLSLITSMTSHIPVYQSIIVIWSLLVMILCLYIGNWNNQLDLAIIILEVSVSLFLFPAMWFTGGGIDGGMSLWFVLAFVFTALLMDGLWFYILTALQILALVLCFVLSYLFPGTVIPIDTDIAKYADTFQSAVMVSLIVILILRFYGKTSRKAYSKIEEQNLQLIESEKKASAASDAKSDFLANMSHEIRTPINAILGMNELIMRKADDPEIRDYAQTAQSAGNALMALINDILDISKIESGTVEFVETEYNLSDLLIECGELIEKRIVDKGLEYKLVCDTDLPSVYMGDADHIRQVLVNVLSNAAKYTNEGSIAFTIGGVKKDESTFDLCFEVRDTGIGMTPQDQERAFEKFERVDMLKNRSVEGTGLGLYITKQLVTSMGGTIEVSSIYGEGSTFTVHLPQKVVDFKPIGKLRRRRTTIRGVKRMTFVASDAKILVVDDMPMNLTVFLKLLERTQIQTDTAQSGMECLEKAQVNRYDIIFMDHMMPELDGLKTFKMMRNLSSAKNADTPVIMLTANALSGAREEYMAAGFADYITKPVRGEVLEEIIRKYLPKKLIKEVTEDDTSED